MTSRSRHAIKLALSAACLLALWHWIDLGDLASRFRRIAALPLAAAMILNLFLQFLNALKLRLLFPAPRPPLGGVVIVNLIAVFFSSFLPGGIGGDVSRWAYLSRESGSKSLTLAAILLDRITGLWAQILLALGAWIWLSRGSASSAAGMAASVTVALLIFGASLAAGLWGYRGLIRLARRLGAWYARRRDGRADRDGSAGGEASADMGEALTELLSSRGRFAGIAALSVTYQLLVVATFLLLDRSIGGSLGWAQAALFLFCYSLVLLLPVTVGNWGVSEGALGALYRYAGSQNETGVLISLLLRAMNLPAALLGWGFFLARRSPDRAAP